MRVFSEDTQAEASSKDCAGTKTALIAHGIHGNQMKRIDRFELENRFGEDAQVVGLRWSVCSVCSVGDSAGAAPAKFLVFHSCPFA